MAQTTLVSFDTLGDFTAVFPTALTGGQNGRWVFGASGSTPSSNTGPGSNNASPYVFTETSGGDDVGAKEVAGQTEMAAASIPDETTRLLRMRMCIQGDFGDGTEGLSIEARATDSDAWVEAGFVRGWSYSNAYDAGDTITDEGGVDRDCVEDGGWIDFAIPIPDGAMQVRFSPTYVEVGSSIQHDVALRSLFWEFDDPPVVPVVPVVPDVPDEPEPEPAPTLDLAGRLDVLLPQYDGAESLRTLIAELIDIVQTEIVDPLEQLDRAFNPDESNDILLDWLGRRLALPRPYVRSADATYFGFDGTEVAGGRPFGQAPFFSQRAAIEDVEPIGDATYRLLLKARARRLRGGANRETLEAVLAILWPNGGGYLDESGADLVLRVSVAAESQLFSLAAGLFDKIFPRPAGKTMTLERV